MMWLKLRNTMSVKIKIDCTRKVESRGALFHDAHFETETTLLDFAKYLVGRHNEWGTVECVTEDSKYILFIYSNVDWSCVNPGVWNLLDHKIALINMKEFGKGFRMVDYRITFES